MSERRVTAVMITHNRRAEADRALTRLEGLPEQPPIIVIDNGSTDGTAEMVADRHPDATLITPGENLGAVGRNLGVARARTPYVAFCDDDTWYDPGALTAAADQLDRHPRLAVVTASRDPLGAARPSRRAAACGTRLPRVGSHAARRQGAFLRLLGRRLAPRPGASGRSPRLQPSSRGSAGPREPRSPPWWWRCP
ncbi:glycosyltransferase family 2 protein [Cumulibacter manganitolerans]|uniref:glycosyltransferase family 2 protein n=1 Tax=Cumulibacter manganitolerans TaxID=1884992 RepID=UPI00129493CB|nr:glycosyltransferase family 2 protein [Cumulibacter manganitolerans]